MAVYRLEEAELGAFVAALAKRYRVFAPVRTDAVRFQPVQDGQAIDLAENSYVPPKGFFFANGEPLCLFDGAKLEMPLESVEPRVFFGVRRCDLNAINHQDIVYMGEGRDPYYARRREATLLIGYHCSTPPSQYCFCGSMKLKDCQDLMLVQRPGYFLVDVGSEGGRRLMKEFPAFFRDSAEALQAEDRVTPGTNGLATTDIAALYGDKRWEEAVQNCLSCGACTALCPTCYCYEISDDVELGQPGRGTRLRCWSSCQLKEFTRVAGDVYTRAPRSERFRHRIYHQIEYFRERYNVTMCTGCGRCIGYCPTRIDWVGAVNRMVASDKQ